MFAIKHDKKLLWEVRGIIWVIMQSIVYAIKNMYNKFCQYLSNSSSFVALNKFHECLF